MYVLARSNLTEMLLNVEYMMELMDPALQLGEGESLCQTHLWTARHRDRAIETPAFQHYLPAVEMVKKEIHRQITSLKDKF